MSDATPLPLRSDTVLGVCEALGQDFRFNPLWLRLAFAASFYWFPLAVIGTYFGLGAAVLLSRLISPARSTQLAADAPAIEEQREALPLAA